MIKVLFVITILVLYTMAQNTKVQKLLVLKTEIKTSVAAETTKTIICDTIYFVKRDTTKLVYSLKDTVMITKIDTLKSSKIDTLKMIKNKKK